MDASSNRIAIIAEVTAGTTPATPAFLVVRERQTAANVSRPRLESPERRANRRLASSFAGLNSNPFSIAAIPAGDTALDLLFSSLLKNTWSTDVLVDGSTNVTFTLEERFDLASDMYRRLTGAQCGTMNFRSTNGQVIDITFGGLALASALDTAIIAGATYVAATTDDPATSINVTGLSMAGITGKLMSMNIDVTQNLADRHQHGSADPFGQRNGAFRVTGSLEIYFETQAAYAAAAASALADLEFTWGSTTLEKYTFLLSSARPHNPQINEGGNSTDNILRVDFMAEDSGATDGQMKITRNVA